MKWFDDPCLENTSDTRRGQHQLAMYAIHLACANSIYCKTLKSGTIKEYCAGVASFLALWTGVDHRKDNPTDRTMGHILQPVFDDLAKYDSMPNRREPYSPSMQQEARRQSRMHSATQPNGVVAVLCDGFEAGLATGFRNGEWAQPNTNWNWRRPVVKILRTTTSTRALVPGDLEAYLNCGRRLIGLDILRVPVGDIFKLWITYRFQKNGDNGDRKSHTRNPTHGGHCCVSALYRQLERFRDMQTIVPLTDTTPLFCYFDPSTCDVKLVTTVDIESFMRGIATIVFSLNPSKAEDAKSLQRWGSHSLRVGAACVLHSMGFQPLDIQWLLRWRSLAFMAYLRNLAILSNRQHEALDRAATMPFLF
jgi:hypothetical protein